MPQLVIPILNSSATLLKGPALYLTDAIRLDKLSDTDYGVLARTPAEYAGRIRTDHRCIFIDVPNVDIAKEAAVQTSSKVRYVLNNFMEASALLVQFAVLVETASTRSKPIPINLTEDHGTLLKADSAFRMKAGTKREDVSQFYKLLDTSCYKNRRLYLTISRFNSALTRAYVTDKIIDLTVSLESMVQDDKNELSFKFALFNSYTGAKDAAGRNIAFDLLKSLYNTRSTIVHGAADETKEQKLVNEITKRWTEVEEIARRAVNRYIFFCQSNDAKQWTGHLLKHILDSTTNPI